MNKILLPLSLFVVFAFFNYKDLLNLMPFLGAADGPTKTRSHSVFEEPPSYVPTITLNSKKAFPTAEGFGRNATGGRGGKIVAVTNLNSSGPGSLDAALKMTGRRIIVFKVAGTISHSGTNYLDIPYNSGNVTVAGETAPGDGIQIRGGEIRVSASNVIIRGLRVRQSSGSSGSNEDCINISAYNGTHLRNIVIDHCSLSWARDENLSLVGNFSGSTISDVTVQNCIISESNYGLLSYKKNSNISVYNNLFIHNGSRNIRSNHPESNQLQFEMVNNLIHGVQWRTNPSLGTKFTVLKNKYKSSNGVSSKGSTSINGENDGTGSVSNTHAYISGNVQVSGQSEYSSNLSSYIRSSPYKSSGLQNIAVSANAIEGSLLPHVGASFQKRDALDSKLVSQYKSGSGSLVTSGSAPYVAGGSSPSDGNKNFLPDSFESRHNVTSPTQIKSSYDFGTYQVVNKAGYTALEIWMAYEAGDFERMAKIDVPADEPEEEPTTDCSSSSITPEYRIDGNWDSGSNSLSLSEGTSLMLSMLPNGKDVTITLPNGSKVGDNYDLGALRSSDGGTYTMTSEDGCTTTLKLTIGDGGGTSGTNCPTGSLIPEYRINGSWQSGSQSLSLAAGTDLTLSMLPNGIDLTITLPNGSKVGDNYDLGGLTSADSGTYTFTSAEGCAETLQLSVGGSDGGGSNCPLSELTPEYRINGSWQSGSSSLSLPEGTDLMLSMLPNGKDVTITLPNGVKVGDDYSLGKISPSDSGTYWITSGDGCTASVQLQVGEDQSNNCPLGQLTPEYRIGSDWQSGSTSLTLKEGTPFMLSMLPNGVGLTITLPNGSKVGDNHDLNRLTPSDSGTYILTSEEGCTRNFYLTVTGGSTSLKAMLSDGGNEIDGTEGNSVILNPNPARENINALLPSNHDFETYYLYDASGSLVTRGTVMPLQRQLQIDLAGIERGLLFLTLTNGVDKNEVLKVIAR